MFIHQRYFQIKASVTYKWNEKVGIIKLKSPKAFINYSPTTDDVYEDLENYNPTKKRKVLIV